MGGLGVVKIPKFPTVFPKIAFEGFFTLSCEKNAQKFFAQKISHHKKNSFKPVLHFLFYKNFCISNQKNRGIQKTDLCVDFTPPRCFTYLQTVPIILAHSLKIWMHKLLECLKILHIGPIIHLAWY